MGRAYSRLILGCGNFGGVGSAPAFFGQGQNREQAFAIMDAAWESGITAFDTADAYGGGRSESWIGEWRRHTGNDPFLITKTFAAMDAGEDMGLAPARVRRQIDSSLDRLGVERVDFYLAHAWDDDVPIAEVAGVFEELVHAGKVGAYGLSNVDADELRAALDVGSFAAVENSYSLLDRETEPVLSFGLDFFAFGPLAGGWLTGKYKRNEPPPAGSRMTQRPEGYAHLQTDAVFDGLERLQERGDPATLALGWLLGEPRVTGVILGPGRPEHLEPALAALAAPLPADQREELGRLFP
ncbi:MAG TPA: aldo/keto reductase [Gaiellaceae bacterium]|nr:aldo/keto reductase [Gaiellaceae bacterium]